MVRPERKKVYNIKTRQRSKENNSDIEKMGNVDHQKVNSDNKPKTETIRTQNKFFKSKRLPPENKEDKIFGEKRIVRKKKIEKDSDEEVKIKLNPAKMRQTTLSESFRRSSIRNRLRPRKISVEYKDSPGASILLENSISPDKRKSIVLLNRIDDEKQNKTPIYKTVEKLPEEDNAEDKDSIYEFQIDPGERKRKMKKKRAPRKPGPTKKRKTNVAAKIPKVDDKVVEKPGEADKVVPKVVEVQKIREGIKKPDLSQPVSETKGIIEPENAVEKEICHGVRVSRVETLTGDRKVSFKPNLSLSRQNSTKFNPFRSTQSIFKPRPTLNVREMMDHSLLNKSLSPIKGEVDTFDAASPWRPQLPNAFSSVKQVVQSTPQIKRNFGRVTAGLRIDERDESAEAKAANRMANPLGVRISNAENIENGKKPLGLSSNYGENKKNQGFGDRLYKSPKKIDKSTSSTASLGSPGLKKRTNQITLREETIHENVDENTSPLEEERRFLKQSNLNTFLNLEEMPESIRINTSHGIFGDDVPSASIVKMQTFKIQPQANIDNCFGFDDDNSDVQENTLKLDKKPATTTPVKKIFDRLKGRVLPTANKPTARISLGEIKNTLYPRREKKVDNLERREDKNEKNETDSSLKSKVMLKPAQFSDTFDVVSENEQTDDKGAEISLFADLEPVHFTKPPRWSYAKKRERKNYYSSDEEDDDDAKSWDAPSSKKRKVGKVNKEEERKISDWVNSVNQTFQEIDDFDLVVEKLA